MKTRYRQMCVHVAGALAVYGMTAAAGGLAHAQSADAASAAEAPAEEAKAQVVVVTGTSIRGIKPTGAAVSTVNREDIEATGATTTTELLRSVPALQNFNTTGANIGAQQSSFVDQPAIHGIGVNNGGGGLTLVLFDGHRLPGAGINQTAPDPSVIPPSALERVEVIPDGASSIYGSDAVAGVINFIPRRNFNGAETALRTGYADGYRTENFSQLWGRTWSGGSLLVDFEHSGNTALNGRKRDWYGMNQAWRGGVDDRSTNCSPANVTVAGATYALGASGARPAAGAGAQNRCDNNLASDLYPQNERNQGLVSLHQKFANGASAYATLIHSRRNIEQRVSTAGSLIQSGAINVTVPSTSPYYQAVTAMGVPATGPHTVTYNGAGELGDTFSTDIGTATTVFVFGGQVKLGGDWRLQFDADFGRERDHIVQNGVDQGLLTSASAAGTFNPYGVGAGNSAALINQIRSYREEYIGIHRLRDFTLKADGSLFGMASGASAKAAVGVNRRTEEFDTEYFTANAGGQNPSTLSLGKRSVTSLFGELYLPVVGTDNAMSGVQRLNVSLSARYDKYDDVGSTTNPKLGVNWSVNDDWGVRASVGRSFHAPSLADAPTAIDTRAIRFGCTPGFVGCASPSPAAYTIILAGGNELTPETAITKTLGVDWEPGAIEGLRVNLTYFDIDYKNVITFPTFGPVTDANPVYDPYRVLNPSLEYISQVTAGLRHQGLIYPDAGAGGPVNAVYDLRRQNFANQVIRGIDLAIAYGFPTSVGRFNVSASGTYLGKFDQQVKGATSTIKLLDTNYAIKFKGRAGIGWTQGAVDATAFVNHTGSYRNTATNARVDNFTTADLHVGWDLSEAAGIRDLRLNVDVNNAFDKAPPFYQVLGQNYGFDNVGASPIGRLVSIGLVKKW